MKVQSVSAVSGAANGRWPHILSALGINVPSARRHGACPPRRKDASVLMTKRGAELVL